MRTVRTLVALGLSFAAVNAFSPISVAYGDHHEKGAKCEKCSEKDKKDHKHCDKCKEGKCSHCKEGKCDDCADCKGAKGCSDHGHKDAKKGAAPAADAHKH